MDLCETLTAKALFFLLRKRHIHFTSFKRLVLKAKPLTAADERWKFVFLGRSVSYNPRSVCHDGVSSMCMRTKHFGNPLVSGTLEVSNKQLGLVGRPDL